MDGLGWKYMCEATYRAPLCGANKKWGETETEFKMQGVQRYQIWHSDDSARQGHTRKYHTRVVN